MTAEQLIQYLQCVKPDTKIGIMYGDNKSPLKSMMAGDDTLYLTSGNYSFGNDAVATNGRCMLVAIAQFAKK